jgi:hypothetical protein
MRSKVIFCLIVVLLLATGVLSAWAGDDFPLEKQAPLPVGTVINTQNWQQYKDYMPGWMETLFAGEYQYKLSPNQQIVVGPTVPKPLPKEYAKNTEQYSGQVSLKELPEGATLIQNYTAGLPFPHPTQPHLAEKIVWNLWYRYLPRVEMNLVIHSLLVDRYKKVFRQTLFNDYMRLGHVSEPGVPIYTPEAPDTDLALYLEVTEPEQSKYTVSLILYFLDPTRVQEIWSFVPSLRRPLRLSASARCSPAAGSDSTVEDQKSGFNMQVADLTAQVVAHKMTLMMNDLEPKYPAKVDFFDSNTLQQWGLDEGTVWPPAPSKWELEETWVVDAKRVPSKLTGYCYGNRRMYIDATDYHMSGEDLSDMGGKLWKSIYLFSREHPNGYGDLFESGSGNYVAVAMDLQNIHQSISEELTSNLTNTQAPQEYWNVKRYGSPTGLLEILK